MPFNKLRKPSARDQSAVRLENFRKEVTTDCHTVDLGELCNRLQTDVDVGLTHEQAAEILKKTGPNALTPSRKKSELQKFFEALIHGFSLLLWVGAALCFLNVLIIYVTSYELNNDHVVLGGVLITVVVVTGTFMYWQERRSQSIMESFSAMVPLKANVIRSGDLTTIDCKKIVLGDLVDIKYGDKVPADLRLTECRGIKVDNSAITGESEALTRNENLSDENYLESKNIVFFGTSVVEGTGKGIVIACGDNTVIGRIAGLTARLKPNKTPMAKELQRFMRIISVWAISLGVVMGILCFALGHTPIQTLLFAIGMIVANVPEGLLATVIVCLTVTAKRMASENCLIKKLDSVETLGCTSVICSDKTGTLTQNRMTVCHLWYNGKVEEVDNLKPRRNNSQAYMSLVRCATLCNRAEFFPNQEHKPVLIRMVHGDASESAILKYVTLVDVYPADYRNRNPKLIEIPFSSTTKYQISVHYIENRRVCMVAMKGAPEVILERCSQILHNDVTKEMTQDLRNACSNACLRFAEMGERVIAFCDLELKSEYTRDFRFTVEPANFPQRGLRFLGLAAMIDPARPQVPDAVKRCKMAGIRVVMVTGDHPVTAKAIATKVGIITESNVVQFTDHHALRRQPRMSTSIAKVPSMTAPGALVIHGNVLKHLLQDELDTLLYHHKEIVFARTSPTQKLQIVEGFQRLGEIVAVTGDGVNDAPALKKADTGISMGITGTEVAQESSDIILLDDNFASIISGIEEGRRIFDNLKKSITYTLASNVPEIMPFLIYTFVGIPRPMDVIAILAIDLLTDMMPAISLAYEKAESDIMLRPPRNPIRDRLVTRKLYFLAYGNLGIIECLGAFLVYFVVMAEHGFLPGRLIGIREDWENKEGNLTDSYGRVWEFSQRRVLEETCYTAFMMAVVVAQWANLLVCKTRLNSLAAQGMGNHVLNASLVVETILTCILSYCPYMYYLMFHPLSWRWWLWALPFAILLFLFDEARKWHIRKYPRGWYQRETFY